MAFVKEAVMPKKRRVRVRIRRIAGPGERQRKRRERYEGKHFVRRAVIEPETRELQQP